MSVYRKHFDETELDFVGTLSSVYTSDHTWSNVNAFRTIRSMQSRNLYSDALRNNLYSATFTDAAEDIVIQRPADKQTIWSIQVHELDDIESSPLV